MTFRKQMQLSFLLGAISLFSAYGVFFIDQVLLGNPPEPYGAMSKLAGLLAFVGLFLIGLSTWRWVARLVLVKTGALEQGYLGDFVRDIPLWQWVLHINKEGKDRDA